MQYIDYREDSSFAIGMPVLYSEIEPTHLFNTMGCRFKPHKPKQPGFFHGLIDKLISASYQELSKENALKNLFLLCSSLDSGDGRQGLQSPSEVIATDLLIKVTIIDYRCILTLKCIGNDTAYTYTVIASLLFYSASLCCLP